jgi:hypothetical protein
MLANHAALADPNMAMMRNSNDENAVVHHKSQTTGSKTPAATKTRRAFGDISNRKKAATGQPNKSNTIVLGKTPANTLKLAPTTKKTPFQTVAKERSEPELHFKRRVDFTLPGETKSQQAGAAIATAAPKSVSLDNSDVDDIELPAGRLWIQQQSLIDDADDDTDISLEGAATFVQDLRVMLKQRHELKMQLEEEEFERHLTELDYDNDPSFAHVFLQDGKSKSTCVCCQRLAIITRRDYSMLWLTERLVSSFQN